MPKHRSVTVSLVNTGLIIEEFHYGPYSRYWWKTSTTNKENTTHFPLRIGQKTKTCLNNRDFFVTIIAGNKDDVMLPGYLCQSGIYVSQTENDPSKAVSSLYTQIFANETRFSGPLVLGWQDEVMIDQLLSDVLFIPILVSIGSLKVFIYGMGVSLQASWFNAGSGYKSSLVHKFDGNKQAIYVSRIEDNKCILEIYQDGQMKKKFEDESPIAVWKASGQLKKYNGNLLFGLENSLVQTFIHQHTIPTCIPKDWNNIFIMESLYNYYLKRRTISNINWHQFFLDWFEQESPIIEIYSQLQIRYPKHHQFSDRELRAWQSMLRAAGSHNVTPWTHKESEVMHLLFKFI